MLNPADVLLKTKINLPVYKDKAVNREHLLEMLHAGQKCRLTSICAPAGFGKTTLLGQWLFTQHVRAAWVSLDEKDNDLSRFWRYVVFSLSTVCCSQLTERMTPLLDSSSTGSVYTMIDAMINELDSLPHDASLILDDLHVIANRQIHDSLAYFIEYLPGNIHLYLSSRAALPFSTAKWKLRGEYNELDAPSLLFNSEEADHFYKDTAQLSLSPSELEKLLGFTEGWVAGLQLFAISLKTSSNSDRLLQRLSGCDRNISEYLLHEVISGLPEDIHDFLLKTSVLQRLDYQSCNAVLQRTDSHAMLESIVKMSLFILPLNEERSWYRYHHLFSEFLQSELLIKHPQTWSDLHRRASSHFAERAMMDEAIEHALLAKDYALAVTWLEKHIVTVLRRGEFSTLYRWFEAFPDPVRTLSPVLSLLYAFTLNVIGQFDRVDPLLADLEQSVKDVTAEQRQEILSGIFFVKANLVFSTRRFEEWFAHADLIYDVLPESPLFYNLNFNTSEPLIRRTSFGLKGLLSPQTKKVGTRFVDILQSHGWQDSLINLYVVQALAEGYYEWDQQEDSAALLKQVERTASQKQVGGLLVPNRITLARLRIVKGEFESAKEAIDEAIATVRDWAEYHWLQPLYAFRARIDLLEGNLSGAERIMQLLQLSAQDKPTLDKELEYLTLVRLLEEKGNTADALRILETLKPLGKREGCLLSMVEIPVLQALVHHKLGHRLQAFAHLHEALILGEQNGYIRSFLDEGERMARLLRDYGKQRRIVANRQEWEGVSWDYVNNLLDRFATGKPQAGSLQAPGFPEPLTQREIVILGLVGQGATNQQIAAELDLTVGTVKVYLNRIYGKLGVSSRTQALLKAQDLGLIVS
ncbi:LuxR C-terminal-related transcriptional regulator [Brevibacillus borstelensis]|uniref:LuxR C-terminal-related transcriptional regulator n=1 Tax=Brevibacillus borstelensis TaxID=45462 RepID=UPI0030C04228